MPSPSSKKPNNHKKKEEKHVRFVLPPLPRSLQKVSMFHPPAATGADETEAPRSQERAFPEPYPHYQPQNIFFYQDKERVEDEETEGHYVCISPTTPSMQQHSSGNNYASKHQLEAVRAIDEQQEEDHEKQQKQDSVYSATMHQTGTRAGEVQQEEHPSEVRNHVAAIMKQTPQKQGPTSTTTLSPTAQSQTTFTSHRRKRVRKPQDEIVQEKTRFKDIIGHGAVKLRIDELILPLGLPPAISNSVLTGIRAVPASILLYGPPGCGKTQLARAIAGEANAAFFSIAPSDVLSKFVGESEAAIRNIFRKAVVHALQLDSKCAVVFFDEIDALGQSRENRGSGEGEGCSRRVLAELLLQLNIIADRKNCSLRDFGDHEEKDDDSYDGDEGYLDGSAPHPQDTHASPHHARIIVVAATNRLYDCDSALLRRFGIQLEVGLPNRRDRKRMLTRHLSDVDTNITKAELEYLAVITEQWSGSAIESLAREAAMAPVRECIRRAAVMRKRASKFEQSGGDASGQEDAPQSPDPDMEARNSLLEGFQKLRPVSIDDFRDAIKLLTGEELPIGPDTSGRKPKKANAEEHYDSSTSSDED